MGSSLRLFGRQRTLHQILGGGFIADVILWRRKDVTVVLVLGSLSAWVLFEVAGYKLLSFVSNVLLLLMSILFIWAKSAQVLNRPPPPIPELHFSEAFISAVGASVGSHVNSILSISRDIALGKNSMLFYRVAICLFIFSSVASCTDFLFFTYSSLAILLTVPVLFEKFEDNIELYVMLILEKLHVCKRTYVEYLSKTRDSVLEQMKES